MKRPNQFERFIAPAWISPEIGKVIKVLIGTELIIWATFLLVAPAFQTEGGAGFFTPDSTSGTILTFGMFAIILVLFHLLVFLIHRRGVESMLGPFEKCWEDYKATLLWVGAVAILICLSPPQVDSSSLAFTRPLGSWLLLSLVAIFVITVQAGTEEIIYRGYLMQQMAVYRPQKWIWMGVPAALFGVAHYFNGYGAADGTFLAVWATLLGLACADLTVRTGNIGAAIGLHTANNLYASLYIGTDGWAGSGFARYVYEYVDPHSFDYEFATLLTPYNLYEMANALFVLFIMWLAARVAVRR